MQIVSTLCILLNQYWYIDQEMGQTTYFANVTLSNEILNKINKNKTQMLSPNINFK